MMMIDSNESVAMLRDGDTFRNNRGEWLVVVKDNTNPVTETQVDMFDDKCPTRTEGQEHVCTKCHRRWDFDDTKPKCEG